MCQDVNKKNSVGENFVKSFLVVLVLPPPKKGHHPLYQYLVINFGLVPVSVVPGTPLYGTLKLWRIF